MKHTPGPWTVEPHNDDFGMYCIREVADRHEHDMTPQELADRLVYAEDAANAALIAAAPDMLEALQVAAEFISTARKYFPKSMHNGDKFDLENACATIGKAIHKATEKEATR